MNANETLDYRPHLSLQKKVDAPLPDPEVYAEAETRSSSVLAQFRRNRPSLFLEESTFMEEVIEEQKESLLEDQRVAQLPDSSPSLYRQILYSDINQIDGDTNVILYDRIGKIQKEIESKRELFVKAYFGDTDLSGLKKKEEKLIGTLGVMETGEQRGKIDYRLFSLDLRTFRIMERYFNVLTEETAQMIESNEPLEKNLYRPDLLAAPLYELRHERAVKDLLEGKQAMDVNLNNDNVGNKLKRLYNLRTRLSKLTNGLSEEQLQEHQEQLRFAEEEIYEELMGAEKDLHKAVESQSSCLAKFNHGFRNKCEILHSLKGGNRI